MRTIISSLLAAIALATTLPAQAQPQEEEFPQPREHFHQPAQHQTVPAEGDRFLTSREGASLALPTDEDSFVFAVFGDRTGGPAIGIRTLQQAVNDVNLIEPDLVMTVGDMIEGYSETPGWFDDFDEFTTVMNKLACPWFPVAGNHDVYWRDDQGNETKPPNEHEDKYEMFFGPLWYAFEHRDCFFVVLYTDEGNPQTGQMSFRDPAAQTMSKEQFDWLDQTLTNAKDARHVFVFVHHPRWLTTDYGHYYGEDWNKVHDRLVDAGNVTAVFAGHIHRMRSDPKDGIEYVTLATVGGWQGAAAPKAGMLHHYNLVTVRNSSIALASIPVGEVMDVRAITGEVSRETQTLANTKPVFAAGNLYIDGSSTVRPFSVSINNPTSRPVEFTLTPTSSDSRWLFAPDHTHGSLKPGETRSITLVGGHRSKGVDVSTRAPKILLDFEYLSDGIRVPIPTITEDIPTDFIPDYSFTLPSSDIQTGFQFNGRTAIKVSSNIASLPQGPLTVECEIAPSNTTGNKGIISKTESAEYSLHLAEGKPQFWIHISGQYITLEAPQSTLNPRGFTHIAGVYDGKEARLYVNGTLRASQQASGQRTTNNLPLLIGAEVNRQGQPEDYFQGRIRNILITPTARYQGTKARVIRSDARAVLAMPLIFETKPSGPWLHNDARRLPHPTVIRN